MTPSRRALLRGSLAAGIGLLLGNSAFNAVAASKANRKPGTKPRTIKIQAKKFVFTPNEITIKKGEHVILELTALDFVHGCNIPDFNTRADIPPGKVTTIALNPTEAGTFPFLCDNFCGSGHEEMVGSIIVV